MSNLLNKNGKKKLLDRGPQIQPPSAFTMPNMETAGTKPKAAAKPQRTADQKVTSVRVLKGTQQKLNALVSLNKADTIDELINNFLGEYLDTHLTKDEKKQYDLILQLYRQKG